MAAAPHPLVRRRKVIHGRAQRQVGSIVKVTGAGMRLNADGLWEQVPTFRVTFPRGSRAAGGFHERQNPTGVRARDARRHESVVV